MNDTSGNVGRGGGGGVDVGTCRSWLASNIIKSLSLRVEG